MDTRDVLLSQRSKLQKQKAEAELSISPMRKERERLAAEIAPVEAKLYDLNQRIKKAIGDSNLFQIDQEIAVVERALGAKSIKAEGNVAPKPTP